MMEVEQAQPAQFLGFSNAWDKSLDGILKNFFATGSFFLKSMMYYMSIYKYTMCMS